MLKPTFQMPFSERPTCTVEEAEAATGLGTTTLYRLMKEGKLASVHIGGRRLVSVKSLLAITESGVDPRPRKVPDRRKRRAFDDGPEAA